jgi:hypothetical protein
MAQKEKWIQGAVSKHPGAFKAKAKAAGKSTAGYASSVLKEGSKASTKTKRQAALAQTLSKIRKGRLQSLPLLAALAGLWRSTGVVSNACRRPGAVPRRRRAGAIVPVATRRWRSALAFRTATDSSGCAVARLTALTDSWMVVTGSVMTLARRPGGAISVISPACTCVRM